MKLHNLLILLSDEHTPETLGFAGHPFVQTPNLDRLSEQGTRFSAAYCNSPICVPARAALATGQYVHQIGYWDNAIAVGLVAPHFPLTVPQEFLDLYPVEQMPKPRLHPEDGFARHPWVEAFHTSQPVDESLDETSRRLAMACYYGLCSFMDHQVESVLETLQESGLDATTRVIYSSDHGDNVGARGLWGKSMLYQESAGVPLILAGPEVPEGRVCATPVSLVDCFPTILEAVGVSCSEISETLPGQSLLELGTQPDNPERLVFSEYHAVSAVSGAFYESLLREIVDPEKIDRRAKKDQAALIETYGGVKKLWLWEPPVRLLFQNRSNGAF